MSKIVMIVVPIVLIGGVFGAGKAGLVQIPGISPPKKKAPAKTEDTPEEAPAPTEPTPEPTPPPKPVAEAPKQTTDPEIGQKKLAALWAEINTPKLTEMTKDWKDPELAAILRKMDPTKVAEFLAALDAKKASALSREIQKQASLL